jgi:hypothetical protein
LLVGALALVLLTMAGCKTGKAGTVPTKSPMSTFEPPDADDLVPSDDDEADAADEAADGE